VRAGALLVLHLHPSREVVIAAARAALEDPSEWVRLAGAGLLAIRGEAAGEKVLLNGLGHQRWEVRFWCIFTLHALSRPGLAEVLQRCCMAEKDRWLQGVLGRAVRSLRRKP
jgi:hypothetical protein